jgi:hypothetical protein
MVLEEQRFIHEDLERLEQAIADRVAEEPRNVRYPSVLLHCSELIVRFFSDSGAPCS